MKLLPISTAALAALALAACQDKPAPEAALTEAAAPVDPVVESAVNDIRNVATDPVTGKPRDGGTAFTSAGMTAGPMAPSATLGPVAPGGPGSTLGNAPPGATVPGAAEAGH